MQADVSVWDLAQYVYCPRKVYFYKTLGMPVVTRKKMEYGKEEHEREHRRVKERVFLYGFDREGVRTIHHDLYLEDEEIGLYGQIDTVVELETGEILPVEVKYSDFDQIFENWRRQLLAQLLAYGLLLEKRFGRTVKRGLFYFPKQRKRKIVEFSVEDKKSVLKDVEKIRQLVKTEKMPRGRDRCGYCEMIKDATTI